MKKVLKFVGILILVFLLGLVIINEVKARSIDKPLDEKLIDEKDNETIKELKNIKVTLGDEIWLGLDKVNIPVVIFNDKYEFLIDYSKDIKNWELVKDDNFNGENYYRRIAENPQAFATNINDVWAGSLSSVDYMNKWLFLKLREEIPIPFNKLIPYQLVNRSQDFHMSALMHECFHAYQATKSPNKFNQSEQSYKLENKYPFYEEKLNELLTKEGEFLSKALETEDKNKIIKFTKRFLNIRDTRRNLLNRESIKYEKAMEWLEGSAKYVELKSYEVALENQDKLSLKYDENMSYWDTDMNNIEKLGDMDSESRFYISGMAQAKLLDKYNIEWQEKIMKDNIYFEDLLKEAINGNDNM